MVHMFAWGSSSTPGLVITNKFIIAHLHFGDKRCGAVSQLGPGMLTTPDHVNIALVNTTHSTLCNTVRLLATLTR